SRRSARRRRRSESPERQVGRRVGGEETLDPEFVQRDVVRRAEAGQEREEAEARVAFLQLDREKRRGRRVEVERMPLARYVGIGQGLVGEGAGRGVDRA